MAKLPLDYVNTFYDSRGKLRHTFRRKGHKRPTLKGKPGDADFMAHYHGAVRRGWSQWWALMASCGIIALTASARPP